MATEESTPVAVTAEPGIETSIASPEVTEGVQDEPKSEDIAKTTTVDDVTPQPTVTHVEAGNAPADAEPATGVDGVQADKTADESLAEDTTTLGEPSKTGEPVKEDKKSAVKELVEKTKAEGKGFFSRFFNSKEKSPKKEKKVKSPKTEKPEPTPEVVEAATPAPDASEAPATEEVVVPAAVEPAEAPAVAAEVKETETAPAASEAPETETIATEEASKEEAVSPKVLKANRRLSARITHAFKSFGKKEHGTAPKDEAPKDTAPATTDETSAPIVSDEAPKLERPIEAEPLKLEEPSVSAPPAAPIVSATA